MEIKMLTFGPEKPVITANDIAVGKDGKFICKEELVLPIGKAVIWREVTGEEVAEAFKIQPTINSVGMIQKDLKKLPYTFREDARSYFKAVYDIFTSEAALLIHLTEAGEYMLLCPARTNISAGAVTNFDTGIKKFCPHCRVTALAEAQRMCYLCGNTDWVPTNFYGTMHSHGTGTAFWSQADNDNELTLTGYHITFGKVTTEPYDTAESFVTAQPEHLGPNGKGTRWEYGKGGTLDKNISAFEAPVSANHDAYWDIWFQTLSGNITPSYLAGWNKVTVGGVRELSRVTLEVAERYKQVVMELKGIPETEFTISESANISVVNTHTQSYGYGGVSGRTPYTGSYLNNQNEKKFLPE